MPNRIYDRRPETSETVHDRCLAARKRVNMNMLLLRTLEEKSQRLNRNIETALARTKFVAGFRAADDSTKETMMEIVLLYDRDPRKGSARLKAFLADI
jgi:hypothetical protein